MSYENAVPKPLKFLISDGKMIDDAGNVIAESETLKDLYTKWEPEVKKYLLSDGSVVDEEGNLIVKNDWWKSFYDGACPKVAKYLHADGTIDENPGSGGQTLYIWNLEEGSDSVILPVGTFEEITVGMKGVACSAGSECMFRGTVAQIEGGLVTFHATQGDYNVTISDESVATEFPDLT